LQEPSQKLASVDETFSSDLERLRDACAAAIEQAQIDQAQEEPQQSINWLDDGVHVLRATRGWIQYGMVGFAILCIVVGAVEALFGR